MNIKDMKYDPPRNTALWEEAVVAALQSPPAVQPQVRALIRSRGHGAHTWNVYARDTGWRLQLPGRCTVAAAETMIRIHVTLVRPAPL